MFASKKRWRRSNKPELGLTLNFFLTIRNDLYIYIASTYAWPLTWMPLHLVDVRGHRVTGPPLHSTVDTLKVNSSHWGIWVGTQEPQISGNIRLKSWPLKQICREPFCDILYVKCLDFSIGISHPIFALIEGSEIPVPLVATYKTYEHTHLVRLGGAQKSWVT